MIEESTILLLREFGIMGLWGLIFYEILTTLCTMSVFAFIGYGIRKAWRPFLTFMRDEI